MIKKKILFILHWLPYPLVSGGHQAVYNGIRVVKDEMDVFISFATFKDDNIEAAISQFAANNPTVKVFPFFKKKEKLYSRIKNKIFNLLFKQKEENVDFNYLTSTSLQGDIFNDAYLNHINSIINNNLIDIVQVEMMRNLSVVCTLPQNVKKIFVHHELQFVRLKLLASQMDLTLSQNSRYQIANLLEIGLLNKYDKVISLSSVDSQKLRDAGVTTPIYDSFAIVNTQTISETQMENNEKILTFVGAGNHQPNYNGLFWFLNNCWPLIQNKSSDYKLKIIGKWSLEQQKKLTGYKNIEFCGFVNDLYEVLHGSVMIVPILIGSGIRMKILEAMSYGVPFVTTTIGAEGISVENGYHCFIADDPEIFVDDIFKYNDMQLVQEFTNRSKIFVSENYSLAALKKNRMAIYESL